MNSEQLAEVIASELVKAKKKEEAPKFQTLLTLIQQWALDPAGELYSKGLSLTFF